MIAKYPLFFLPLLPIIFVSLLKGEVAMRKLLRYGLVVSFLALFVLYCISAPAWGYVYDNPAEAAFSQTNFEFVFPYIFFSGQNNLLSINTLNKDFGHPDTKKELLAQLEEEPFILDFSSQLKAGLTIGRFSLHLRPFFTGSMRLPYGFSKYALLEPEEIKGYNDLSGTRMNGLTGISFDFNYGHPFPLTEDSELGVGVTFRYVQGYALADWEITDGKTYYDQDALERTMLELNERYLYTDNIRKTDGELANLFANPPGSGFLTDLGVVYNRDRLRAGLALKNIGVIKWKDVVQGTRYLREELGAPSGDSGESGILGLISEECEEETVLPEYSLHLPPVLQVQGSYRLVDTLYYHLGMETGLADGWGISSKPSFHTGLEWRPRHLLRLAGGIGYHDGTFSYDGLLELRLFFLWLNLHLGWVGQGEGVHLAAMTALHF